MKNLFHHTYTVKGENGRFRPVRFTDKQMDLLEKISPVFLSSHRSFLCGGTEKGQPFFSAALNGYLFHFGLYGPAPREESFIGGFSMYSFSDEESPISKKIFLYVLLRNAGG